MKQNRINSTTLESFEEKFQRCHQMFQLPAGQPASPVGSSIPIFSLNRPYLCHLLAQETGLAYFDFLEEAIYAPLLENQTLASTMSSINDMIREDVSEPMADSMLCELLVTAFATWHEKEQLQQSLTAAKPYVDQLTALLSSELQKAAQSNNQQTND